jgi:hypothetical protein
VPPGRSRPFDYLCAQFEGTLLRVLEPELVPLWCDPEL